MSKLNDIMHNEEETSQNLQNSASLNQTVYNLSVYSTPNTVGTFAFDDAMRSSYRNSMFEKPKDDGQCLPE